MSFLKTLADQDPGVEYPPGSGLRYRLKALVGTDLLCEHVALLAAVLPPSQADREVNAAINEAVGQDKAALQAQADREAALRALDPDLQARAWQFACTCVCASVTHACGSGGEWGAVTVVADDAARDHDATPARVHLSDLPGGTIQYLSSVVRTTSFGGEDARQRVARFLREQALVSAPGEVG